MTLSRRGASAAPYDLLAVGCGPFNLGLSALASTVPDLRFVALEETAELRWHPGILFDDATLQVSFLADLVTLVDPTHPLSFLAYLKDVDRMYPFYVRERFHLTRREYELYLRWAAERLPAVRFSHRVERVTWDQAQRCFQVTVHANNRSEVLRARHLALGVGTEAHISPCLSELPPEFLVHSGEYLTRADAVTRAQRVAVVGSGQSGAEVVLQLLRLGRACPALSWLTRTDSFAPLDYTKLVLEMTTPEYMHYFHGLPEARREQLVRQQFRHYKGISTDTLEEIHDELYRRELVPAAATITLRCGVEVERAVMTEGGSVRLLCRQRDTDSRFEQECDLVVAATGYRHRAHEFLQPLTPFLLQDRGGRLRIGRNHAVQTTEELTGHVFVANADLYSHGVAAPDLGIGAYRNATILNTVMGKTVYPLPQRTAFTQFSLPAGESQQTHACGSDAGNGFVRARTQVIEESAP